MHYNTFINSYLRYNINDFEEENRNEINKMFIWYPGR